MYRIVLEAHGKERPPSIGPDGLPNENTPEPYHPPTIETHQHDRFFLDPLLGSNTKAIIDSCLGWPEGGGS